MKRSNIIMLIGALLPAVLFVLPMWNITLKAPQYPSPIGMNIYINKFTGAGENDIKNINIMNHYVGMKEIPEQIPEFSIFPYVVAGIIALGLLCAFLGKRWLYVVWFSATLVLGCLALYDFYLWEYEYGHDLKENAAIKFTDENGDPMTYQPPLIGNKHILNFEAISMPRIGAYLVAAGMGLSLLAFYVAANEQRKTSVTAAVLLFFLAAVMLGCQVKPQIINFGSDACDYCKMTIVDRQHMAELVTAKGKSFKYDAIECMLNDLKQWDRPPVAMYLVADYVHPGELADATDANFLISPEIPSPMGANLSAFSDKSSLSQLQQEMGGEAFDWARLKEKFDVVEP